MLPPHRFTQKGGVPGGHNVIWDGKAKEPFISPVTEQMAVALRHDDVVVDLGAYCGTYAVRCARFPVRHVYAYEPTPDTYALLAGQAPGLPNLTCFDSAVVPDSRRTVDLHISKGIGVTNGCVQNQRKSHSVTVPAVMYEHAVMDATVVKIDVEGLEYTYPVLCGANLRALLIDFHPMSGRQWQKAADKMVAEIEAAGFEPVISPNWSNGWTCAGAWVRDMPETGRVCVPLMDGEQCCGCGCEITSVNESKSICSECWERWLPKHRTGFQKSEKKNV